MIILKTAVRKTISHKIQYKIFNQMLKRYTQTKWKQNRRKKDVSFIPLVNPHFHHHHHYSLIAYSVDILLCVREPRLFPILFIALEMLPFVHFVLWFLVILTECVFLLVPKPRTHTLHTHTTHTLVNARIRWIKGEINMHCIFDLGRCTNTQISLKETLLFYV